MRWQLQRLRQIDPRESAVALERGSRGKLTKSEKGETGQTTEGESLDLRRLRRREKDELDRRSPSNGTSHMDKLYLRSVRQRIDDVFDFVKSTRAVERNAGQR